MRLRFTTADQVFEAFPVAKDDISHAPLCINPVAFVELLQKSPTPEDAIGFCSYLFSKLDAVAWACRALRGIISPLPADDDRLIRLAEHWCEHPDETSRRAALTEALEAAANGPSAWAALAAGWSGGSLLEEPNAPVPPAPHLTAQAVRAAILTAIALRPARERQLCLDRTMQLARDMLAAG